MPAKKTVAEPVATKAAPVAAATKEVESSPAKAGKTVAKKDKKVEVVVPETPVVAVAAESSENKEEASGSEVIVNNLLEKFTSLSSQIKGMQSLLKLLAKEMDKQKKIIDKVQKKREKAKKSPSGFAKPCKISDDLCDFIGVPKGSEKSRTDITRFINSYVKEHNLNNPQNRREFFPDKKLKAILNVKDGEKVTYFVLQRLISHHFPVSMSKLAAAAKA